MPQDAENGKKRFINKLGVSVAVTTLSVATLSGCFWSKDEGTKKTAKTDQSSKKKDKEKAKAKENNDQKPDELKPNEEYKDLVERAVNSDDNAFVLPEKETRKKTEYAFIPTTTADVKIDGNQLAFGDKTKPAPTIDITPPVASIDPIRTTEDILSSQIEPTKPTPLEKPSETTTSDKSPINPPTDIDKPKPPVNPPTEGDGGDKPKPPVDPPTGGDGGDKPKPPVDPPTGGDGGDKPKPPVDPPTGGGGGEKPKPPVDTEAPTLKARENITVNVGQNLNPHDLVDVVDNEDPNPLLSIAGNYDTSQPGTITVTVVAIDKAGNRSDIAVTVTVVDPNADKDTEAPVITAKESVTVNVGDSLSAEQLVTVTDNKDPNPTITVGNYDTSKPGTINVEVTAVDKAGNSATTTVTVTVVDPNADKDTEAPIITAKESVTVNVGDSLSAEQLVTVTDNKDPNPTITVGNYDTSKPGTINVEVTAVDKAGNSATTTVTVTVVDPNADKDTEAPIITAKENVTVNVGDSLSAGQLVTVTDNEDKNPIVSVGKYDTSKPGVISIEVIAVDKAGNSATTTVTVTVVDPNADKDTEAPIITAKGNVTVNAGDSLSAEQLVTVTDNKDTNPTLTIGKYDTSKPGVISVEVMAADKAGNRSVKLVNVTVIEKQKPEQKPE
ncbi:adhesin, partial [Bacillus paramycoides]|uniref:adhesin n=1 Tax=Bacillus paramycoides TaxID=2026194 RepID=UPI002E1FCA83|nr:adhesin [Bacillus paramycoides]